MLGSGALELSEFIPSVLGLINSSEVARRVAASHWGDPILRATALAAVERP